MELYEIRIEGYLDDRWANWFNGLKMKRDNNSGTTLYGPVADQSALHGFLAKIRAKY